MQKLKSPYSFGLWAFCFLYLILVNSIVAQNTVAVKINNKKIDAQFLSICFETHEISTEQLNTCLLKILHQELSLDCLCKNDFMLTWSAEKDSLDIYQRKGDQLHIIQKGFNSLPISWTRQIERSPKKVIKDLNGKLDRLGYSRVDARLMRSPDTREELMLVMQKLVEPSSVDLTLGFGSGDAFSIYGQGNIELTDLLTNFSKSTLKFERLAKRNSLLYLDHNQLKSMGLLGPNELQFHVIQRDSLFRMSSFSLMKNFYALNEHLLKISFEYATSINKTRNTINESISGNHRNIGWAIEFTNFGKNNLDFFRPTVFQTLYKLKVKQLFKRFDSNQINEIGQPSFSNQQLFRLESATNLYLPIKDKTIFYLGITYENTPSDVLLASSEVGLFGGIQSIRGYPENAFLARDAFIIQNEWRNYLSNYSYIYLFTDWARLAINQEINAQESTAWTKNPKYSRLISSGFGFNNRVRNTQTNVLVAFTREFGFFNPRIHLSVKRLF